jgi:NAD(P)-dependent dehydrogenase (short-subunit alcohol dehydrogenase family)
MKDKICLVTGGSSGVGKATALGLAKLGATIVLLCRNQQRGEVTQAEIIRSSGNQKVDLMLADLSVQDSVRKFVREFKGRFDRLDVLSNNAGIVLLKRQVTSEGIEKVFATNYLGHFLLTNLLLDVLKISSPARVTNVSGPPAAVRWAQINFDDMQFERRFSWMQVNTQALLANVVFTFELARRLEGTGVTANAFFPGLVRSKITRNLPWYLRVFPRMLQPFFKEECRTSVYLASSPEVKQVNGKFFVNNTVVDLNLKNYDDSIGARLWGISEVLTGLG